MDRRWCLPVIMYKKNKKKIFLAHECILQLALVCHREGFVCFDSDCVYMLGVTNIGHTKAHAFFLRSRYIFDLCGLLLMLQTDNYIFHILQ